MNINFALGEAEKVDVGLPETFYEVASVYRNTWTNLVRSSKIALMAFRTSAGCK
jgi:hypothetical protein